MGVAKDVHLGKFHSLFALPAHTSPRKLIRIANAVLIGRQRVGVHTCDKSSHLTSSTYPGHNVVGGGPMYGPESEPDKWVSCQMVVHLVTTKEEGRCRTWHLQR